VRAPGRPALRVVLPAALAVAAVGAQALPAGAARPATAAAVLKGTFRIQGGSYFRMRFPTGGGYFKNPDSRARDKTYTTLSAGSGGGLVSGAYQGQPRRAFDGHGNSHAGAIIRPQAFAGIRFGLATFPRDPVSRRPVPAPGFVLVGRRIYGQTTALTAAWNKLYFNQGVPKPGARGTVAIGSYDPRSHRYVLSWSSRISSGPFNGFTGVWRLAGTFVRR